MNWFRRLFIRKIEITIKKDDPSCLEGWKDKYVIYLNPAECLDIKTTLAHELGHFMDNVVEGMTKPILEDYKSVRTNGTVTVRVLKWEASAWRNALKIHPKLDKKHLKYAFGTYFKSFKNPRWWMLQQMEAQQQLWYKILEKR